MTRLTRTLLVLILPVASNGAMRVNAAVLPLVIALAPTNATAGHVDAKELALGVEPRTLALSKGIVFTRGLTAI